ARGEAHGKALKAVPVRTASAAAIGDRRPKWLWPGVGIAAALVLSAGIVIGRRLERTSGPETIASRQPVTVRSDSAAPTAVAQLPQSDHAADSPVDSTVAQLRQETRNTDRRVHQLASAPNGSSDPLRTNLAYQLVVMRHLAGAEAMITSFRSTAERGQQDAAMASWARELLGTTRTLEASPVARDAVMKRLLDDLDLVITQIVQYTTRGTYDPGELQLIEQSIDKRSVMSKLRSTLPDRRIATGL
ncbi:MAG TPA: hypothetical protein VHB25_14360, partial [Gemmatimonadaceae bacterium]|nr:hypothetical protein [Gemmatimonadaceae bacterium]